MATLYGPIFCDTDPLGDFTQEQWVSGSAFTYDGTDDEIDNASARGQSNNGRALMYHTDISQSNGAIRALFTNFADVATTRWGLLLRYNATTKVGLFIFPAHGTTQRLNLALVDFANNTVTALGTPSVIQNYAANSAQYIEAYVGSDDVVHARVAGSTAEFTYTLTSSDKTNLGTQWGYAYRANGATAANAFSMDFLEIADDASYLFRDAADDFNRADSTNLGAGWSENQGDMEIVSNAARPASASTDLTAVVRTETYHDNQYVRGTRTTADGSGAGEFGVALRGDPAAATYYWITKIMGGTSQARINKVVDGSLTNLATATLNDNSVQTYYFFASVRTIGGSNLIKAFVWSASNFAYITATDTAITGPGAPGFAIQNGSGKDNRFDNFQCGPLLPQPILINVSDTCTPTEQVQVQTTLLPPTVQVSQTCTPTETAYVAISSVAHMDAGGNATYGTEFWPNASGSPVWSSDVPLDGPGSIKCAINNNAKYLVSQSPLPIERTGHFVVRMQINDYPTSDCTLLIVSPNQSGVGRIEVVILSDGYFYLKDDHAVSSEPLPLNIPFRLCVAWNNFSTQRYTIKAYVDGVLQNTRTQAEGPLNSSGTGQISLGAIDNSQWITNLYIGSTYLDNGGDLNDLNVRVTAKLPAANNVNQFEVNVGNNPTNRWENVNERPRSNSNGWATIMAETLRENYGIQARGTGDVDLTSATLVARTAWIFSSGGGTVVITDDGEDVNIGAPYGIPSLYTTSRISQSYPASPAAIGVLTTASATLYECGVLIAYIPAAPAGGPSASDTCTPTEQVSVLISPLHPSASESPSPTEQVTVRLPLWIATPLETVTPTEVVTVAITRAVSVQETIALTEVVTVAITRMALAQESASPTEQVIVAVGPRAIQISEVTTPTESAGATVAAPSVQPLPSVSESTSPGEQVTIRIDPIAPFASEATTPSEQVFVSVGSVRMDDFQRVDGGLGSDWASTSSYAPLAIVDGGVTGGTNGSDGVWQADAFGNDQWSEILVRTGYASASGWLGVWARRSGSVGYQCITYNSTIDIYAYDGAWHLLASIDQTVICGDRLRLIVSGSDPVRLRAVYNGVVVIDISDTVYKYQGGAPGVVLWSPDTGVVESWAGGDGDGVGIVHPLGTSNERVVDGVTYLDAVSQYTNLASDNANTPLLLRYLEPDDPAPGMPHRLLLVLPVETNAPGTTWGDGLDTVRAAGLHNTYNLTLIAPQIHDGTWGADSATASWLLKESFLVNNLLPWIRATLNETDPIWIIGFSRSGYAVADLMLRHPNLFALGAAWDAPMDATWDWLIPNELVGLSAYEDHGTQANFEDNYQLTQDFIDAHAEPLQGDTRLWIAEGGTFGQSVNLVSRLAAAGVPSAYANLPGTHRWDSPADWVPAALAALAASFNLQIFVSETCTPSEQVSVSLSVPSAEGLSVSVSESTTPTEQVSVAIAGHVSVATTGGTHSYSTSFPTIEDPLSESGKWLNGLADGGDWLDVEVTANGAQPAAATSGYNDPTAIINPAYLTFDPDQRVSAVVYNDNPGAGEIELRLRSAISAGVNSGYEFLYGITGAYTQIVRWNGSYGDFDYLAAIDTGPALADGDVIEARAIGPLLLMFHNGHLVLWAIDSTFTSGQPGIGFYGDIPAKMGVKSFSCTDNVPQIGGQGIQATVAVADFQFPGAVAEGVTVAVGVVDYEHTPGASAVTKLAGTCTIDSFTRDVVLTDGAGVHGIAWYSARVTGAGTLTVRYTSSEPAHMGIGCVALVGVKAADRVGVTDTNTGTGSNHTTNSLSNAAGSALLYAVGDAPNVIGVREQSDLILMNVERTNWVSLAMQVKLAAGTPNTLTDTYDTSWWRVAAVEYLAAVSAGGGLSVSVSESTSPAEQATVRLGLSAFVQESTAPSEVVTVRLGLSAFVQESTAPTEQVSLALTLSVSVQDAIAVQESAGAGISTPSVLPLPSVSEPTSPIEIISIALSIGLSVSEPTSPTELVSVALTYRISALEPITPAEQFFVAISLTPAVSESVSPSEQVVISVGPIAAVASDSVSPIEVVTSRVTRAAVISEATAPAEVVTVRLTLGAVASETVTPGEQAQASLPLTLSVTETVTPSDSASASIASGPPALQPQAQENTSPAEVVTVRLNPILLALQDVVTPTEVVTLVIVIPARAQEPTAPTEVVAVQVTRAIVVTDTTAPTEQTVIQLPLPARVQESTSPGEQVTVQIPLQIAATQAAAPSESILVALPLPVQAQEATSPSEAATVAVGPLSIQVSDTVTPGEQIIVSRASSAALPAFATENATPAEQVSVVLDAIRPLASEVTTPAEQAQASLPLAASATEAATPSEQVTVRLPIQMVLAETLTPVEVFFVTLPLATSVQDLTHPAEQAQAAVSLEIRVQEVIAVGEVAGSALPIQVIAIEPIVMTEVVASQFNVLLVRAQDIITVEEATLLGFRSQFATLMQPYRVSAARRALLARVAPSSEPTPVRILPARAPTPHRIE